MRGGALEDRHALDVVGHREEADGPERDRDPSRPTAAIDAKWRLTCDDVDFGA